MLLKIPVEKHKELSEKYLSGISAISLSKEYKVSWTTVLNMLKRNGIKIRPFSESNRKYPINENFFDVIDTQEKAYFLGFLFADGCNHEIRVSINLSEKDKDMLEKLNLLIHPKGKPLYRGDARTSQFKNKNTLAHTKVNYHLVIENKHVAETLSKYGCVPRKTNVLQFPHKSIKPDMLPHFIRGYFDGDGSISLLGKFQGQAYISITSTRSFCESIRNITKKILRIESVILEKNYAAENVTELRIRIMEDILKFLEWIYKDSTIHLNRKYERYQKLHENREYLSITPIKPKCVICGQAHYGKGYCNRHYLTYARKVIALIRAKKSLVDFLSLGIQNIDPEEQVMNLIKYPPAYKMPKSRTKSS